VGHFRSRRWQSYLRSNKGHCVNEQFSQRWKALDHSDFIVERLDTDRDSVQYFKLLREIWGNELGLDVLAKKLIEYQPNMTLRNIYVVRDKDKMVSTLNLIPVSWSMGGIELKVAEMGFVGTLPEYRGKGLIRKLVEEYHKDVEAQGYDLAVIEGIPYFYRQFGYEYAIPLLEETRLRLDQIPDYESTIRVRQFVDEDVPTAIGLLEKTQEKYFVHSIRDEAIWKAQQRTSIASDPEPFQAFIVEEKGRPVAYFRMREVVKEKELLLTEISEVDQCAAQAVLAFLKEYGLGQGLETLSVNVSYEEPFTEQVLALGGTKRFPVYAWQLRVTDYAKMFEKMKPLLESRLARSMYCRLTETLSLNFRNFIIEVTCKDGKVMGIHRLESGPWSPIGLNPTVFVQLLTGYRSREEMEMAFPDVRIAVSHRDLIDVLFPKLPSYIHSAY
jgi:predicted acetyltransferase